MPTASSYSKLNIRSRYRLARNFIFISSCYNKRWRHALANHPKLLLVLISNNLTGFGSIFWYTTIHCVLVFQNNVLVPDRPLHLWLLLSQFLFWRLARLLLSQDVCPAPLLYFLPRQRQWEKEKSHLSLKIKAPMK